MSDACHASYSTSGSIIGGAVADTPGAIVGGLAGTVVGVVSYDKDTGGGGEGGGDGCVVM